MNGHVTMHPRPLWHSYRWLGIFRLFLGRGTVSPVASDQPVSRRHVLLAQQEAKKHAERQRLLESLRQSKRESRKDWRLIRHITGK